MIRVKNYDCERYKRQQRSLHRAAALSSQHLSKIQVSVSREQAEKRLRCLQRRPAKTLNWRRIRKPSLKNMFLSNTHVWWILIATPITSHITENRKVPQQNYGGIWCISKKLNEFVFEWRDDDWTDSTTTKAWHNAPISVRKVRFHGRFFKNVLSSKVSW